MADARSNLDPRKTALLVMDYQPGILGRLENADAVLTKAKEAIGTARECGATVGYVRVAFTPDELNAVPDRNKGFSAAKSSGADFGAASASTQIDGRIAPEDGDIVVRKTRVGAFSTTGLNEQLQTRGIDTLILAGISTSGVILSTVRDGADRDYRLFVLSDACADPQQDVHAFLIDKILPRQADVITTADLSALFSR